MVCVYISHSLWIMNSHWCTFMYCVCPWILSLSLFLYSFLWWLLQKKMKSLFWNDYFMPVAACYHHMFIAQYCLSLNGHPRMQVRITQTELPRQQNPKTVPRGQLSTHICQSHRNMPCRRQRMHQWRFSIDPTSCDGDSNKNAAFPTSADDLFEHQSIRQTRRKTVCAAFRMASAGCWIVIFRIIFHFSLHFYVTGSLLLSFFFFCSLGVGQWPLINFALHLFILISVHARHVKSTIKRWSAIDMKRVFLVMVREELIYLFK